MRVTLRRLCEEIAEAHLTYKETRKRDGMRANRTPASFRITVSSFDTSFPSHYTLFLLLRSISDH